MRHLFAISEKCVQRMYSHARNRERVTKRLETDMGQVKGLLKEVLDQLRKNSSQEGVAMCAEHETEAKQLNLP